MPRSVLYADPIECTSCRACQLQCSFVYEKVFNPEKARQQVVRIGAPALDFVIACQHCAQPACMAACPNDAIYKTAKGVVMVKRSQCDGNGSCIRACPIGAMKMHPKGYAFNCIACGKCVDSCPVCTLRLVEMDEIQDDLIFQEAFRRAQAYRKGISTAKKEAEDTGKAYSSTGGFNTKEVSR